MRPYETIRIKKGDMVHIHAGKDKGKQGRVVKILPEKGQVFVQNANMVVRNIKKKTKAEKGQQMTKEAGINISNVLLYCIACKKGVRHGVVFETAEKKRFDGTVIMAKQKKRICRSCQQELLWPYEPEGEAKNADSTTAVAVK